MPPFNILTVKQKLDIYTELYGRSGPLPQLKQVVPGKFYYRGDCSYIRCRKCNTELKEIERHNRFGRCDKCEAIIDEIPYPKDDFKSHNKRMLNGMVLSNSCNYERWS